MFNFYLKAITVKRILLLLFLVGEGTLRAQTFTSSNLPIIVIDTEGQDIVDDPKITARMGVIYNGAGKRNSITDPFNHFEGTIGIELRGNVTMTFEKKSYRLETRDAAGADLPVGFFGMPKDADWVLSASYLDKTFIREPLVFNASRKLGRWAPRTAYCELVLNGTYMGIYVFTENIKRDKNRVDITKLLPTDNSGDLVTGGYIYEVSQTGETFGERRRFIYPKADEITPQQTSYIQKYDDDFRAMMQGPNFADPVQGYPKWIDVGSFIDQIILQEMSKNSDAYAYSSYFFKDRLGKLNAGPMWDLDQSLSNSIYNDGPNAEEWTILKALEGFPLFWEKLFNEPAFKNQMVVRWDFLRSTVLKTSTLMTYIDSAAAVLNEAQQRNFQRYDLLGKDVWRTPPGFEQRTTYQSEVNYLKTFLTNRLLWMDDALGTITGVENENDISRLQNYPNPVSQQTTISYSLPKKGFVNLSIHDVYGRKIETIVDAEQAVDSYEIPYSTHNLPSGMYIYTLKLDDSLLGVRKMIIRR